MNEVNSILLIKPKIVKTRAPRGKSRVMCDFCYKRFRNKENRYCHRFPWNARHHFRDIHFHQTCYRVYLHITALALFQEINNNGTN